MLIEKIICIQTSSGKNDQSLRFDPIDLNNCIESILWWFLNNNEWWSDTTTKKCSLNFFI